MLIPRSKSAVAGRPWPGSDGLGSCNVGALVISIGFWGFLIILVG